MSGYAPVSSSRADRTALSRLALPVRKLAAEIFARAEDSCTGSVTRISPSRRSKRPRTGPRPNRCRVVNVMAERAGGAGAGGAGDGSAGQRPQPGLADLPRLVEESRDAGARVQLYDRVADPGAVPGAAGRTAYRVVQEGLTNARKHAPGEQVQVVIDGRPGGRLLIDIRNPLVNGHGAGGAGGARPVMPAIGGSGTGLIGLTERVRLAGGELDHQVTDGEFRLSASLPWPA